jgi:hypothetical protein
LAFSTLDVEHIDDESDIMHYDDLMMVGPTYHWSIHFDDELGSFDDEV